MTRTSSLWIRGLRAAVGTLRAQADRATAGWLRSKATLAVGRHDRQETLRIPSDHSANGKSGERRFARPCAAILAPGIPLLFVRHDPEGGWIVLDEAGRRRGRFLFRSSALTFAGMTTGEIKPAIVLDDDQPERGRHTRLMQRLPWLTDWPGLWNAARKAVRMYRPGRLRPDPRRSFQATMDDRHAH
ncbi:hypothetical protein KQX62_15040 [Rhodopseudomonas palustris]|uniref:Uncharacterized protein n=1 Tax=Rhodopseudomonas palustris TaxID=1076 RepID=A0AAX3DTJ9_RHOPL|nr:hypothetical protein [Rhodopseudomonas palustris]UYO38054.1 hypothetical protein KQX62_15040 [Rhodopseudomonas palustris]